MLTRLRIKNFKSLADTGDDDAHPFVSTARQTLDRLLAGDAASFSPTCRVTWSAWASGSRVIGKPPRNAVGR
jgi:hypothetical protein